MGGPTFDAYISIMVLMFLFTFATVVLLIYAAIALHGDTEEDLDGVAKTGYQLLITTLVFDFLFIIAFIVCACTTETSTWELPMFQEASRFACICALTVVSFLFLIISSYSASYLATDPNYKKTTDYTIGAAVFYGAMTLMGLVGSIFMATYDKGEDGGAKPKSSKKSSGGKGGHEEKSKQPTVIVIGGGDQHED